jgi:hypothetical protein
MKDVERRKAFAATIFREAGAEPSEQLEDDLLNRIGLIQSHKPGRPQYVFNKALQPVRRRRSGFNGPMFGHAEKYFFDEPFGVPGNGARRLTEA